LSNPRHERQATDLAAARARWQARPFTAYRLTLTLYESGPPGGCQQALVIRDEQVAEVIRNECQRYRDPMTVSDLFTILEPHPEYATSIARRFRLVPIPRREWKWMLLAFPLTLLLVLVVLLIPAGCSLLVGRHSLWLAVALAVGALAQWRSLAVDTVVQ
jgi:hypothetical protein